MAGIDDTIYELKESAKWSLDVDERKKAIRILAGYGPAAVKSIAEVRNVAVYDEIKVACVETIKAASAGSASRKNLGSKTAQTKKKKKINTITRILSNYTNYLSPL